MTSMRTSAVPATGRTCGRAGERLIVPGWSTSCTTRPCGPSELAFHVSRAVQQEPQAYGGHAACVTWLRTFSENHEISVANTYRKNQDDKDAQARRFAIVTGASSGIG